MPITAKEKEGLFDIGQSASFKEFRRIVNSVHDRRDALQALLDGAKENKNKGFMDGYKEEITHKKIEFVTEAL